MATATKALQTASPPKTHNPVEASNNLLMPQEQPDTRPNTNKLGKDDLDPIAPGSSATPKLVSSSVCGGGFSYFMPPTIHLESGRAAAQSAHSAATATEGSWPGELRATTAPAPGDRGPPGRAGHQLRGIELEALGDRRRRSAPGAGFGGGV